MEARWEPCIAETMAMSWGLELAKDARWDRVEVETDALSISNALNKNEFGSCPRRMIVDDVESLMFLFSFRKVLHVALGKKYYRP